MQRQQTQQNQHALVPQRRVAVVEPLHLGSTRVPHKITQRVGGRRLLDIGVEKLAAIRDGGVDVFIACCEQDEPIVRAANRVGLLVVPMTKWASEASDWTSIYAGFGEILKSVGIDWVLHTHVTCHPFVRPETMLQAVAECRVAAQPFVLATEERSIAWTRTASGASAEILGSLFLDSRTSPPLIRPSHLGGACPVDDLMRDDGMDLAVPFVPRDVRPIELLDCDTLHDLELLQIVADGLAARDSRAGDWQDVPPDLWCDGPLAGQRRE